MQTAQSCILSTEGRCDTKWQKFNPASSPLLFYFHIKDNQVELTTEHYVYLDDSRKTNSSLDIMLSIEWFLIYI